MPPVDPTAGVKPKYRRIENDMRRRIQSRDWAPGMMIPSRKSLTVEYGVDLRTIQRAISALIGDGNLTAQGGRGTFVTAATTKRASLDSARILERAVVALVVDQPVNQVEVGLKTTCRMIGTALKRELPNIRLLNLERYVDSVESLAAYEGDAIGVLETEAVGGAIMSYSGIGESVPRLQNLLASGLPIVFIDRYPADLDCDYVGADNKYAAIEGVNYLLSLGHKRIAFIAPNQPVTSIDERLIGYRYAIERGGLPQRRDIEFRLPLSPSMSARSLPEEVGRIVRHIKNLEERPTALFAVNDVVAHHVINAAEEIGLEIPRDLSVLGFDDIDRYSPRPPILTTIRQSFESIGERAAELLIVRMRERNLPAPPTQSRRHILLPTQLVVRKSTAPPATSSGQ